MTSREEAENIIERMRAALAGDHRRPELGLLALILGRHPQERDAILLHTIAGQAALTMNPAGQLIIRSKGDPILGRYLVQVLNGAGTWDARQRGWRIAIEDACSALARIITDRSPVRERGAPLHPASPPKPTVVVIHSAYGIATGERMGDAVTMRIVDARLRAALEKGCPCGTYDGGRSVGAWHLAAIDLDVARAWMDQLY